MKRVGVYFDAPKYDDYPFTKEEYRKSYHNFAKLIEKKGGQLLIVRSQQSYMGGNKFSHAWHFENGSFVYRDEPITVDVIYNKGYLIADSNAYIVNEPGLEEICTNKWQTFELFEEFSPYTSIVQDTEQMEEALGEIESETIVAKPVDLEEGKGVFIGSPEEVAEQVEQVDESEYLIQEFIDSSNGIPGIVDGTHDFRVISIQGEITLAFVRTPPPGGLLANVAQGGQTLQVQTQDIPQQALEVVEEVESEFTQFDKRIYAVDLALDQDDQWKIIELNAKPALFSRDRGEDFARFHENLADLLIF